MSAEAIFVLVVLLTAIVLFATEALPVDLVAGLVMVSLILGGVLSPAEGLAGFANPATVTVGAMFVLSAALVRSGALSSASIFFEKLAKRGQFVLLAGVMATIGGISAFVNNTAAVAVFLPIVLAASKKSGISPSKVLMPLSFASIFGGTCTLIGTSTNLLVDAIARDHGQPAFGMFEFAPLGLILLATGFLYMLAIGVRLLPDRGRDEDLAAGFRLETYLTDLVLGPEAPSVGRTLSNCPLVRDLGLDILEVVRDGNRLLAPPSRITLQPGDSLRVRGDLDRIRTLTARQGVELRSRSVWRDEDLTGDDFLLLEAIVAPGSPLDGSSLRESRFYEAYGGIVLGIRHRGGLVREAFLDTRLKGGDVLLVEVPKDRVGAIRRAPTFVVVTEVGPAPVVRKRALVALTIVFLVVAGAATGMVPILTGSVVGALAVILTGCLRPDEAYSAMDWRILFLLAGVLSLGAALEKSGLAATVSGFLVRSAGDWGPLVILSLFYLLTSALTEAMSNNATAVLLVPVAIQTAENLHVDPRPFLVAVAVGASASFLTPVGYQTNTLVYGPGEYRFSDFVRVGAPLNLIFWGLATFLIPVFWPF